LTEAIEPTIHVLDPDASNIQSMCGHAVYGDKAITMDQARDPNNDLFFNCEDCYNLIKPNEV
jgi:hypothetical protein